MRSLVNQCPFLETLKINMVLFDLPEDGISILLKNCTMLKNLGLVVDRNAITSMCANKELLNGLDSLEITFHIGITTDQMTQLIDSDCLQKLVVVKV